MFSTKEKGNSVRYDTLISQKTEIRGELHLTGAVHVDGVVKGNIIAEPGSNATIRISEKARIEGQISAPNIIINGSVQGNVVAYDYIELAKKAKVEGDITYRMMEIVLGAEVNGKLHQQGRKANDTVNDKTNEPAPSKAQSVPAS